MARYSYYWSKISISSSGCGSVGIAVDSDSRGPRFVTSHVQNYIERLLSYLY